MISENINDLKKTNIVVCDPIKNSIIQYSNFYKFIYTNEIVSLNGIYVLFDLNLLWYNNKTKYKKITEFMNNGSIKYTFIDNNTFDYNNKKILNNAKIILKISGIWESGDNIGLTFKIILVNETIDITIGREEC